MLAGPAGRLVRPGYDPMPIWKTILLGLAATVIAGVIIGGWFGYVIAVMIAAVLVSAVNAVYSWRKG